MATIETRYDHNAKSITVILNSQAREVHAYDEALTGTENHDRIFRITSSAYGYWGKFYRTAIAGGYMYVEADDVVEVTI